MPAELKMVCDSCDRVEIVKGNLAIEPYPDGWLDSTIMRKADSGNWEPHPATYCGECVEAERE